MSRIEPTTASRRRGTPFGGLRPAVAVAVCYFAVALLWVARGASLPGGRWLAVHLFTLGVLTNLVVALSAHFAQTLMHAPDRGGQAGRLATVNAGALLLLVGLPAGRRWLVATGASLLMAAVLWLYFDLRRMRKRSLTGRFAFVVRAYERACSAFLHGALLGALMGTAVLGGGWYASARSAHMHANVLGWGGLTLLGTVVFFGPTVMRARMEEGADAAAARGLRAAATGLSVAVIALLLTGAGGAVALPARLVAAGGLVAYAVGVAAVCLPVVRTGQRAQVSAQGRMLQAASVWFVMAAAADAVVVATDQSRLLLALGVILLVGVLAQAILGSLGYLTPMAFSRPGQPMQERAAALRRLGALPGWRPAIYNLGVAAVAATVAAGPAGPAGLSVVARIGWLAIGAATAAHLALLLRTMATNRRAA